MMICHRSVEDDGEAAISPWEMRPDAHEMRLTYDHPRRTYDVESRRREDVTAFDEERLAELIQRSVNVDAPSSQRRRRLIIVVVVVVVVIIIIS